MHKAFSRPLNALGSWVFHAAPNQHRPFCDLRQEPGDTGLTPLPVVCSHIHSKTACRGFKSFCPCQKSQVSLLRYLTFSLVCGRIWQRGAPAGPPAVRVVGRWSPVATVQRRPRRQPRPSPSAPATKPAKTLGFHRFSFCMCCMAMVFTLVRTLGFLIWFYPSSTVLIPSSTRNAPDFGCFRMNSGASLFFCWFSGVKFSTSFLSTLPIWFTSRSRW